MIFQIVTFLCKWLSPDPKFSFSTCICAASANPQEVSDTRLPFLFVFHLSLELLFYILLTTDVFASLLSSVCIAPLRDRKRQQMIKFHTDKTDV